LNVPAQDPYFYINRDVLDILQRVRCISRRHPVNVLVSGRQGCGKSSLVRQYAAVHGYPLATFQVGILSEPGQLFGEYTLENGATRYKQFLFPQAIQTPDCVIHLEEINRPEHPKALNMLFSLLSDDRQVWMDELGLIKVADSVTFFATLNEGDGFVGTELLDLALRDRFYQILMDYLPADVEQEVLVRKTGVTPRQAADILSIVTDLRSHGEWPLSVSTRTTLMIAEMVDAGATLRRALTASLQTDNKTLERVLLALHLEKGHIRKTAEEYLLFSKELVRSKWG